MIDTIFFDVGNTLRIVVPDKEFIANAEENKIISETFGVMSIPRFLIINPDGTIHNAEAFRPSDEKFKEKLDAALQ